MFELLFNYPVTTWREATLVSDAGWSVWPLVALCALASIIVLASLWKRSISAGRKSAVWLLQSLASTVVLFMFWQPSLLVAVSERGENAVAWVVDNSASMQRADLHENVLTSNQTRFAAASDAVKQITEDPDSEFTPSLYALGTELVSQETHTDLENAPVSKTTNLADGLDVLLSTVNDTSLAAVVLMTDGADNAGQFNSEWWRNVQSAGIPVHTVGIGRLQHVNDIELADVIIPNEVQPNTTVKARLRIRHAQQGTARVRITSGKNLLAALDIQLPENVNQSIHAVSFPSGDSGVKQMEFSIESINEDGSTVAANIVDPIPQNNRQPRVLRVMDSPKRILYVEGEPRWEFKFIRRAVENDPSVNLVSLLRTSPNKFYRQGVASATELADGVPESRAELFRYDAIIIGSIDAAEFSTEQQAALRDFVSIRGGSLLMLAGRHGLADGGWGRSVTAAALPVVLSNRRNSKTYNKTRSQAIPTLSGLRTPWLNLHDDQASNTRAWQDLPALADVQSIGQVKPGAITLLERESTLADAEPLFVLQRYGKGRSAVLGTSGTWRWQMSLPSDDDRHERFWSQVLGALVESSTPPIDISIDYPVVRDVQSTAVTLQAYNPDFTAVQQSTYPVQLNSADGVLRTVELHADTSVLGRYVGNLPVLGDGAFSITATAPVSGESPSYAAYTAEQWWVSESQNAESYDGQLKAEFLQRIANVTGGTYLPLADVEQLNTLLKTENAALKREDRLPLWNMPFLFMCLLLLKGIEWLLRLLWKRL